jgi:hypothetical protein
MASWVNLGLKSDAVCLRSSITRMIWRILRCVARVLSTGRMLKPVNVYPRTMLSFSRNWYVNILSFTDWTIPSKFSCLKQIYLPRRLVHNRSSLLKVASMQMILTTESHFSFKSLKVLNRGNPQMSPQWKQIVHQVLTLAISRTRTNTNH